MAMSKKDFISLADAIKAHNRVVNQLDRFTDEQLNTIAQFCAHQNSRFMRERWFGYIAGHNGPSGGKIHNK